MMKLVGRTFPVVLSIMSGVGFATSRLHPHMRKLARSGATGRSATEDAEDTEETREDAGGVMLPPRPRSFREMGLERARRRGGDASAERDGSAP